MISFVYFDVGGVVILDFSGTKKFEALKKSIGVNPSNAAAFNAVWETYKEKICIDCDVDTLMPILEKEVGLCLPKSYSLLQDFVDRFDPNPTITSLIKKIHIKHKIGLLTNMYPRMFEAIKKRNILPDILWDTVIDSSVVGYQKPDKKIFEIAERVAAVSSEEIFYIDNSIEHVAAAKALGWKTFLYDSTHPEQSTFQLQCALLENI